MRWLDKSDGDFSLNVHPSTDGRSRWPCALLYPERRGSLVVVANQTDNGYPILLLMYWPAWARCRRSKTRPSDHSEQPLHASGRKGNEDDAVDAVGDLRWQFSALDRVINVGRRPGAQSAEKVLVVRGRGNGLGLWARRGRLGLRDSQRLGCCRRERAEATGGDRLEVRLATSREPCWSVVRKSRSGPGFSL